MLEFLLPLHPRVVHFPIALTLAGALFAALGLFRQKPQWMAYGQMSLLLGWLGAIAAIITGLFDQSAAPQTPEVLAVINQHITAGIALLVAVGLALYWPLRNKRLWNAGRHAGLPGAAAPYCGAGWHRGLAGREAGL